MAGNDEQQRGRNAKRLLWLIAVAVAMLLGVVAYTSLEAPGPGSRVPEGTVPASQEGAMRQSLGTGDASSR